MQHRLVIGTRGSPLALWQAGKVRDDLLAAHAGLDAGAIEIRVISTRGDRVLDRPLAEIGGKGLFTEEIEDGLVSGALDCAVHSTKDMPTALPAGLVLAAFLEREDPRDALISRHDGGLDGLPPGAVVGTASLRRKAQLLARRPDLVIVPMRGNVQTRLARLAAGEVDATLLAHAGMKRLGLAGRASALLDTGIMLPAPAQGVVCVEIREDDARMRELLAPLDHPETARAVAAERALLAALDGSCRTPIAALARCEGSHMHLEGRLLALDGSRIFAASREGEAGDPDAAGALGHAAGMQVRDAAGEEFFAAILAAS